MSMKKSVPEYWLERKNIVTFLIFTMLFSLIFINIYKPFSSDSWTAHSQTIFFLYSLLIVVAGMGILTISRTIMYKTRNRYLLAYWQFLAWIIIEIALIALIYTFYVRFAIGLEKDFIDMFMSAFLYTILVLFIPYIIVSLYFALQNAESVLERISTEEHFVNFENLQKDIINFKDDKETLRLSVKSNNLLYIESDDNYVKINYLNKGKLSSFPLRNSLKTIEEVHSNNTLMRCHRSYIVNLNKVKILRKDKDGIYLEMDMADVPDIPISKSYSNKVTQYFSEF